MLKNYFKVAFRHLVNYKVYSLINITGLAVGISCCMLIMLFVKSELSYDNFHVRADRIYRVWQEEKYEGQDFRNTFTPIPMAAALQESLPEIEYSTRVYVTNALVGSGARSFNENIHMVDPSFFNMFSFHLISGDSIRPFANNNSILITPDMAKKYFGDQDPRGRILAIRTEKNQLSFTVSGVIEKSPENSSIKFSMLIPAANIKYTLSERMLNSWSNIFTETYVLLKKGVSPDQLRTKFPAMLKTQLGKDYHEGNFIINLLPVRKIHLTTSVPEGIEPNSDPKYAIILSATGILILLVACINFVILAISRSASRAKEVGVRKVLGAGRQQIVRQFWGEAILVTVLALILGVVAGLTLLKPFNSIINRSLRFEFDIVFLIFCVFLVLIIGLIAGIYPAIFLSRFSPAAVLKGRMNIKGPWLLRQGMIIAQFACSIILIICTIAIGSQLNFLQNKDLGYRKDQVVIVPTNMKYGKAMEFANLYRSEILKNPQIVDASIELFSLAETSWGELGFTDHQKIYRSFQCNEVDDRFAKVMDLKFVAGRNFLSNSSSDKYNGVIINEAFAKEYGWKNPIGQKLPGKYTQTVIGVLKDFNYQSLHEKIDPLVLTLNIDTILRNSENVSFNNAPQPRISVKLRTENLKKSVELLGAIWKQLEPNQAFESRFLDESLASRYIQEEQTNKIAKLASGLSIFVACMGLFGLASLTVARRMKEIGIRKVLGASVRQVAALLSGEFIRPVLIAFAIASPLAWYAINKWLEKFAYHITLQWWMFVLGGIVVTVVSLLTVSIQSTRAAGVNPVKSLKSE